MLAVDRNAIHSAMTIATHDEGRETLKVHCVVRCIGKL